MNTPKSEKNWDDLMQVSKKKKPYPLITITLRGDFNFNLPFFNEWPQFLSTPYVLVSYSKKNSAILFDFLSEEIKGETLKLCTLVKNKNYRAVYGRKILNMIGYSSSETKLFIPYLEKINNKDKIVIYLGEPL